MTQLQGFGALLYGAIGLVLVAVLAVTQGGPLEITLAALAIGAAWLSQYFSFLHAYAAEYEQADPKSALRAWVAQLLSLAAAAASFLLSVWF